MKITGAFVIASLSLLVVPLESEAKRGFGSLFKAGRGASAINGVKNYDLNTLTVGQLKQCLNLESEVENSETNLINYSLPLSYKEKILASVEADMNSLGRYIKLNQDAVFYTQAEVDTFNNKVGKYNKLISVYNTELEEYRKLEAPYNNKVGAHNAQIKKFKMECAGKRYYEDDLIAINNGMK